MSAFSKNTVATEILWVFYCWISMDWCSDAFKAMIVKTNLFIFLSVKVMSLQDKKSNAMKTNINNIQIKS
jgi:hypothetical protein